MNKNPDSLMYANKIAYREPVDVPTLMPDHMVAKFYSHGGTYGLINSKNYSTLINPIFDKPIESLPNETYKGHRHLSQGNESYSFFNSDCVPLFKTEGKFEIDANEFGFDIIDKRTNGSFVMDELMGDIIGIGTGADITLRNFNSSQKKYFPMDKGKNFGIRFENDPYFNNKNNSITFSSDEFIGAYNVISDILYNPYFSSASLDLDITTAMLVERGLSNISQKGLKTPEINTSHIEQYKGTELE